MTPRKPANGPAKWCACGVLALIAAIQLTLALRTPSPDAQPTLTPARLNINTAPAEELELLPGIGPVAAAAIIDHRSRAGPFRSAFDLDQVKGIGPETIERLRPLVRFGPSLTPHAPKPPSSSDAR